MTSLNHKIDSFPVWTALVTPLDDQGSVDYDCLAKLVKQQQSSNNALLLCGSTGEGLALETEEQLHIIKFVCDLKPQVPLMVAVGGFNLNSQITLIEQCNRLDIDAYLLTAPIYSKPGVIGQTQWFESLMDAAAKPCMLYNVPSRSGVSIPEQTVANLAEHKNLWAMKEASGDINQFLAYQKAAPQMRMYSGEDGLMPYLASAGAVGLVSVCANVWPEATHLYVEQSICSINPQLFSTWKDAIESLFVVANPIPVKVLMHKNNQINTPVLRAPLTHLELESDQQLISANDDINHWFIKNSPSVRAAN